MRNSKIAFVLVGGVCSGKTTLAKVLEAKFGYCVISKDQSIYESDIMHRENKYQSWEEVRLEKISKLNDENIVLDETIRVGKLKELKEKGYTLYAIALNTPISVRKERLLQRSEKRIEILTEISKLLNIDVLNMPQDERRNLWRDETFILYLDGKIRNNIDSLIKDLYILGADYIKPEEPNPMCFDEIDYVYTLDYQDIELVNPTEVMNNAVGFDDYLKESSTKIKYCVWDVGGVFYKYSLDLFGEWCLANASEENKQLKNKECKVFFNNYMNGGINFSSFCQNVCKLYGIEYTNKAQVEIEKNLRLGIGRYFDITEKILSDVERIGIINCLLSNALPLLEDCDNFDKYIRPEYRFYSFEIKELKPNIKIYEAVKQKLKISFNQMIFIDDKLTNVNAAKDLGIYSIKFEENTIFDEIRKIIPMLS